MDTSPRFTLPLIIAAQAQKHLTHNEALAQLETLVQPVVQDMQASQPPLDPQDADCVVVGASASGAFAGKENAIAAWVAGAWHFHVPQPGWMVIRASDGQAFVFATSGWIPFAQAQAYDTLAQLGINATASSTNRLTVASDASLFTASTHDHRLTINKAGVGDTASMVFQSGWSGRAEMGLAGEDGFAIKVSADGGIWHEALRVDPSSGQVTLPQRPLARGTLSGGTVTYPAGREAGFSGIELSQGGMVLGSALPSPASGAPLVIPADGIYQITLCLNATSLGAVELVKNASTALFAFDADVSSQSGRSVCVSALANLNAGDSIKLRFVEAATCQHDVEGTWLDVVRL